MALVHWIDTRLTEHRLAALELRYKRTLGALTAARSSYSSVSVAAQLDEMELLRALARVQHLQGQVADLQVAIELLEDGVTA